MQFGDVKRVKTISQLLLESMHISKGFKFCKFRFQRTNWKWKRAGLEGGPEKFDVIIGDLSDPHEGGPCNHLYTKSFYEEVIKPKLNDNGIFVTQVHYIIYSKPSASYSC